MRIEKLSSNVTVLPLSPGERAGVRASVNAHSTENVEEPIFAPDGACVALDLKLQICRAHGALKL
jgi:hypothetical protein